MPELEIQPFSDEHLERCRRALLEERHRPPPGGRAAAARARRLSRPRSRPLGADDASGAVALRGGELVGYLLGARRATMAGATEHLGRSRGPRGQGASREPMRDLYAAAAEQWVERGRIRVTTRSCPLRRRARRRMVPPRLRRFSMRRPSRRHRGRGSAPTAVVIRRAGARMTFPTRPGSSSRCSESPWPGARASQDDRPAEQRRGAGGVAARTATATTTSSSSPSAMGASSVELLIVSVEHRRARRTSRVPERAALTSRFAADAPEARGSGVGVALTDAVLRWARRARLLRHDRRTGARRTCSRRASGRGAASAGRSSGSTARSLDPPAAGVRLAARRRRSR